MQFPSMDSDPIRNAYLDCRNPVSIMGLERLPSLLHQRLHPLSNFEAIMREITLPDFLTEDEIRQCKNLWHSDRLHFHDRVLAEVVQPNMQRINKQLGQENDASYLSYAIE